MLVDFRVRNFRSIREEQCLSFIASADNALSGTHCMSSESVVAPRLLRSAVVYGANASGKSNLIFALSTMQQLVLGSTRMLEPQFREQYTPFRLDTASSHDTTEFEIALLLDGIRYQYGFAYDSERIRDEWLLVYKSSKAQRWFEYHYNPESGETKWENFSSHFKGEKRGQPELWKASTARRSLFLTQAAQSNSQQLQPLFNWFANRLIILPANSQPNLLPTLQLLEQPQYKEKVLNLMKAADIHVSDIKVEKQHGQQIEFRVEPGRPPEFRAVEGEVPEIRFGHLTADGEQVWFDQQYESYGTQRLLGYSAPLLDAMANGKLLVVDEFDTSLHPLLTRHTLRLLHDPTLTNNGAQLWMTTHDTSLLDPQLLRRDQIWFVEKGAAQTSELYSLTDFSPRKTEALERGYLQGRYGAVPFLTDFLF